MQKLATTYLRMVPLLLLAGALRSAPAASAAAPRPRPLQPAQVARVLSWVSHECIQNVSPAALARGMVNYLCGKGLGAEAPALQGDPSLDMAAVGRWLDKAVTGPHAAARRSILLRDALRAALKCLDEAGTELHLPDHYMEPAEEASYDKGGVGIEVDQERDAQNRFVIFETLDGFPGEAVGLKPGDRIVKVGGKSVIGISYRELADLVDGELGTRVTLTVERPGQPGTKDYTVQRVWLNPNPKNISSRVLDGGIGYIRFKYLGKRMSIELLKALETFKPHHVRALVLDLRNNESELPASEDLAGVFLPGNSLVTTLVGRSHRDEIRTFGGDPVRLPIVALVNRYSSGAAILLAGALRDAGRATVVGEPTVWRDQPQSSRDLPDGSVVTVTTGYYLLPHGEVLRARRPALQPDELVRQDALTPLGGSTDRQLQKALAMARARLASASAAKEAPHPTGRH